MVELDASNNLVVHRNPIAPFTLYIQASFPLHSTSVFRKLTMAVCGLEIVTVSEEILELKYEYEVGSSMSGANGDYLWRIFSDEFEQYYSSDDDPNCPIYNYEVVAGLITNPDDPLGGKIIDPNPYPNQVQAVK